MEVVPGPKKEPCQSEGQVSGDEDCGRLCAARDRDEDGQNPGCENGKEDCHRVALQTAGTEPTDSRTAKPEGRDGANDEHTATESVALERATDPPRQPPYREGEQEQQDCSDGQQRR